MARSDEGKGPWVYPTLLALVVVLFFSRVLFTDQIIRASDVITQFFWSAKEISQQGLGDYLAGLPRIFQAQWEPLNDGGRTLEGGWNAIGLLFHRYLIQHFLPFPASIAWLAVLALLWGGLGTYRYCRLINLGPLASFGAGLLFALCAENASLLNAGHIQKMEAIGWMPWALVFLEQGIARRRLFPYVMTALVLAVQFFHMHWQISFYTCLTVGGYWCFAMLCQLRSGGRSCLSELRHQTLLATLMTVLFLATVAMSLAPLVSWSSQSERGGGMAYEEGMSWSMPPEEVLAYVVPGFFGLSRQEEGDLPLSGQVHYWGRMHFSQTNDYLGILPWLFLPLPLLLRRDRHTLFFAGLMGVTLLMAMGKYTLFYDLIFRFIPGFSTFRVPKMILFLFAFAAAVLMAQGMELVRRQGLNTAQRERWLAAVALVLMALAGLAIYLSLDGEALRRVLGEMLATPTRYQSGSQLLMDRYQNMVAETMMAASLLALYLGVLYVAIGRGLPRWVLWTGLLLLFVGDLWRVNSRFLVLTDPPVAERRLARSDVVQFLEPRMGQYRMQPLDGQSPFYYADYGLPNLFAYVTVSEMRYRGYLEQFNYLGGMPDMMNLRYLVMDKAEYGKVQAVMGSKYRPVFESSSGSLVLENTQVLPKAWLVSAVLVEEKDSGRLAFMAESPRFKPAEMALVETPPPFPMAPTAPAAAGDVHVERYEANRLVVRAHPRQNSLLVLGEKYYRGWGATVNGRPVTIHPVNHILRGVYLPPGEARVEFVFDPVPFKVGTWLTLSALVFYCVVMGREWRLRRRRGCP